MRWPSACAPGVSCPAGTMMTSLYMPRPAFVLHAHDDAEGQPSRKRLAQRVPCEAEVSPLSSVRQARPRGADGAPFAINIADSLWGEETVTFQEDFVNSLASDVGVSLRIRKVDFEISRARIQPERRRFHRHDPCGRHLHQRCPPSGFRGCRRERHRSGSRDRRGRPPEGRKGMAPARVSGDAPRG